MRKYTDRVIDQFISVSIPPKTIGMWYEGKFCTVFADESKSKCGVKYNRLIRLSARIRTRANTK